MGYPKKRKKGLIPFKPGPDKRRNMKGAPKLPNLKEIMAEVLGGPHKRAGTVAKAVIEKLKKMALAGDKRAIEQLIDRGYGKSTQIIEQTIHEREATGDVFPKD